MRKKIVAGNWKMNKTFSEAKQLFAEIASGLNDFSLKNTEVIIVPPYPYLNEAAVFFENKKVSVAAQNCSEYESGAYTGEVSASMLSSIGVNYVILGHSERRMYFKETSEEIKLKTKQAIKNRLIPVFCIGENLEQRNSNKHKDTVRKQLVEVFAGFSPEEQSVFIIAYEPVWAIGTGVTATSGQAQEMHAFIREQLATLGNEKIASEIPVLYGGSCNEKNAGELFSCPDVDGGLIGGASLKADSFLSIINSSVALQ